MANQEPKFWKTNAKLFVLVGTLSTWDRVKLLKQLESGFKRTIYWNKYQFKITTQTQNRALDFLIDSSLDGVNWFLFYLLENENAGESYRQNVFSTVEVSDYNVISNGRIFFLLQVKTDLRTYDNIQKIVKYT